MSDFDEMRNAAGAFVPMAERAADDGVLPEPAAAQFKVVDADALVRPSFSAYVLSNNK